MDYFSSIKPWAAGTQLQALEPRAREAVLRGYARDLRLCVLNVIHEAGIGHVGGDLSAIDTLATLFGSVLRFDPAYPLWRDRDRFILSKGHCAASLYSVLAYCGFMPGSELGTFAKPLSSLNGHPNRRKVPGVETNTGPLGHGLPVAVGCATAAQIANESWRTFVVLGDGELQEGSNWEAIMYAAHRKLNNLTAIVDRNGLQQGAKTENTNSLEPLADKWRAFGWEVLEVDGHDIGELYRAFTSPRAEQPRCVIARTTKGRGVSFMEGGVEWHHKVPNDEQFAKACQELGAAL